MSSLENLNPAQIEQLIHLLQQMLPEQNANEDNQSDDTATPIKTKKINNTKRRKNKFLDMPEHTMHKADSIVDKKLNVFPPTPRSRDFSYVDVVCRVCGKQEKVSPKLVPESINRYKCNNCSSSEG